MIDLLGWPMHRTYDCPSCGHENHDGKCKFKSVDGKRCCCRKLMDVGVQ